MRFSQATGRRLIAGVPTLWLLVLFLIPFIIVFRISFSEVRLDSGSMLRVTLPNVRRGAERPITREERVWLSWHGSSPVVLTE